MSSHGYAPSLWLECRANPVIRRLYLLFSALLILSVWLLPWAGWQAMLASLALAGVLWFGWMQRCELGAAPLLLHWDEDGQWWRGEGANKQALRLDSENLLSTGLIVLRFRHLAGGWRTRMAVILTPAAIGSETFRRLTLRLRCPVSE